MKKKSLFVIILSVACLCTVFCIFSFGKTMGDLDGNGTPDASDARLVLRAAVGLEDFSDIQKSLADINADGKIGADDARRILRAAVGLETLPEITDTTTQEISSTQEPSTEPQTTECPHSYGDWHAEIDNNQCLTQRHYRVCSLCRQIQYENHSVQILQEKSATCTEKGLTQGTECPVCNTVLTAQTETDLLPHTPGEWQTRSVENTVSLIEHYCICEECKNEVESVIGHEYLYQKDKDETSQYYQCQYCEKTKTVNLVTLEGNESSLAYFNENTNALKEFSHQMKGFCVHHADNTVEILDTQNTTVGNNSMHIKNTAYVSLLTKQDLEIENCVDELVTGLDFLDAFDEYLTVNTVLGEKKQYIKDWQKTDTMRKIGFTLIVPDTVDSLGKISVTYYFNKKKSTPVAAVYDFAYAENATQNKQNYSEAISHIMSENDFLTKYNTTEYYFFS